ncbi:hypothetical protein [Nocardioides sp. B-3]|uniref:hypothetical protein n=1 Tax=Nocardioides sp. B-3 TaxID=2895565 RepID=UPI00215355AF|nr:hypothetical protein [Nocardioides sp. B-3]UUZ58554.1 hypothetical protein LP418_20705 [Nocardioides sp. B-3]
MTEVMLAAHRMTPKMRTPTSPSACWKAEAGGLSAASTGAAGHHAEDGEEEQGAHDASDDDPGDGAASDHRDVLRCR